MNEVGAKKEELDTPALLIDLDLMEKNLKKMADFLRAKNAKLRPHIKVHRTPIIARKQIESGAVGVCCQKVRQAEVMVEGGIKDVFVPNIVATPSKISRLASLARYANVTVLVDDDVNAEQLSSAAQKMGSTLGILVDVHVGSERFGVGPGQPALELARKVGALKGLRFLGLMANIGFLSYNEPRAERRAMVEKVEMPLVETKELLEKSGIKVERLSSGSTGTYDVSANNREIDEIRPGSYALMDRHYHEHVPEFDCAMRVLGTVISKHPEGIIVLDVGMASMSVEHGNPELVNSDGLEVHQVHAENLLLKAKKTVKITVGDKIELIPSYLDGTVVRHEKFYGMRNGQVETVWDIMGRDASY